MASLPTVLSTGPDTASPEQIAEYIDQYRPVGPVELFLVRRLATQAARSRQVAEALAALLGGVERRAHLDTPWDEDDATGGGPSAWTEEIAPHPRDTLQRRFSSTLPPPGPIPIRRIVSYAPVPYRVGVLRRRREEAERQYANTLRDLRKLQARRCATGMYVKPVLQEAGHLRILSRPGSHDGAPSA
jgi:hypothetical protein